MNKRMYVGNLDYNTTDKELEELFSQAGTVTYSKVIMRMDGKSRGFGFVEMESEEQAKAAIEKLNQSDFKGRTIVVNEARTQTKGNFDSKERNSNYKREEGRGDLNYKLRQLKKNTE
ncbi:MAG: RNA-binding protein [Candidatus Hydromicrobium americanum]|nr:MAG: RNA-binding protein [Candidatus Hydromicrobium americanum]